MRADNRTRSVQSPAAPLRPLTSGATEKSGRLWRPLAATVPVTARKGASPRLGCRPNFPPTSLLRSARASVAKGRHSDELQTLVSDSRPAPADTGRRQPAEAAHPIHVEPVERRNLRGRLKTVGSGTLSPHTAGRGVASPDEAASIQIPRPRRDPRLFFLSLF